jgi:hypothetical protein
VRPRIAAGVYSRCARRPGCVDDLAVYPVAEAVGAVSRTLLSRGSLVGEAGGVEIRGPAVQPSRR